MIVYQCAQGSPEWFKARAGVFTASNFHYAMNLVNGLPPMQQAFADAFLGGAKGNELVAAEMAGYKMAKTTAEKLMRDERMLRFLDGKPVGELSEVAKDHAFKLAVERISGEPLDEGNIGWVARRGHELEPEARREHEFRTGLLVEEMGFIATDDRLFGASVDGHVSPDTGTEYKCFLDPQKLRAIHIDDDPGDVTYQTNGGLFVTGWKKWAIGVYCPALKPVSRELWLKEYPRDDDLIESMMEPLMNFIEVVNEYEFKLRKTA